jgi:hypothetical protein
VISKSLARHLRDAGLRWEPTDGDRFYIPDRDLDEQVFSISEMTVDVRDAAAGRLIAFNGTVEWALDAIMEHEVVWLPTEGQLRDLLGDRFLRLERTLAGFTCEIEIEGERHRFHEADAAESYGLALLLALQRDPDVVPPIPWSTL